MSSKIREIRKKSISEKSHDGETETHTQRKGPTRKTL